MVVVQSVTRLCCCQQDDSHAHITCQWYTRSKRVQAGTGTGQCGAVGANAATASTMNWHPAPAHTVGPTVIRAQPPEALLCTSPHKRCAQVEVTSVVDRVNSHNSQCTKRTLSRLSKLGPRPQKAKGLERVRLSGTHAFFKPFYQAANNGGSNSREP
jgi:hypothetical protein